MEIIIITVGGLLITLFKLGFRFLQIAPFFFTSFECAPKKKNENKEQAVCRWEIENWSHWNWKFLLLLFQVERALLIEFYHSILDFPLSCVRG